MAFFRTKVWEKDEILAVAKRNGSFFVDRKAQNHNLRKKLRKLAKDLSVPLRFECANNSQIHYAYAPEKLNGI
jgi:hypothetical protein